MTSWNGPPRPFHQETNDTGLVSRTRFPRYVYAVGTEPDPRFTLANERTFLAWIRTALALIAGGIALEAFALPLQPTLRLAASIILLLLGLLVPVLSWYTWATVERALRRGAPLPGSTVALPVALGVATVAVLVLLGILTR
jgi:putative membrane protein